VSVDTVDTDTSKCSVPATGHVGAYVAGNSQKRRILGTPPPIHIKETTPHPSYPP